MTRDPEESVRWMLSNLDERMLRSRAHGIDAAEELRLWIRVYNEVEDQLPPKRQETVLEIIDDRHGDLTSAAED